MVRMYRKSEVVVCAAVGNWESGAVGGMEWLVWCDEEVACAHTQRTTHYKVRVEAIPATATPSCHQLRAKAPAPRAPPMSCQHPAQHPPLAQAHVVRTALTSYVCDVPVWLPTSFLCASYLLHPPTITPIGPSVSCGASVYH